MSSYQSKTKSYANLKRQKGNREYKKTILIAVEGEKTEYLYFSFLKRDIKNVDIKVATAKGGDPVRVVEKAQKSGNYDDIYCVFDYDNRPKEYEKAIEIAKQNNLITIKSIPCFEIWFILHYRYTNRDFEDCAKVADELTKELIKIDILKDSENYADHKNQTFYDKLFPLLEEQQETAIGYAEKLKKLVEQNLQKSETIVNPYTEVHELVKILIQMKATI